MKQDELLDLVNDKDEVTGSMLRSDVYKKGLRNFRVVVCFLVNSKGELWIPTRANTKETYPGCLDFSFAGHVKSGKTYFETLISEGKDEANLDVTKLKVNELGKLTPKNGVSAFEMCYEIQHDKTPNFNPRDFSSGKWIAPKKLIREIENGAKARSDLLLIVKHFYT